MHRTILTASAAMLLVATGAVHGLWTDRWNENPEQVRIAAERLEQVPFVIGKWEGKDLETDTDPRLRLAGVLERRYVHQESGKVVTIYLACGRPGPICVHSPDACYVANGFTEAESPRRVRVAGAPPSSPAAEPTAGGDEANEFWVARYMRQRPDGQMNLRIFWSWHSASGWKVADNPRVAFAGEPVLHKLYVQRELASANEPAEGDVCTEFMQELLPVLEQKLFVK